MGTDNKAVRKDHQACHILVIRLSAMGDVAMTVPVISVLLRKYPNLRITVATRKFFAPLFSSLENVSVYEVDVTGKHKGATGLWKLFGELKRLEPDAVADLHHVLRSNTLKLFFSQTGIPFIQIDKGRAEKKALTASRNKIFEPLKTTHERYADVFKKLGFPLELAPPVFQPKETLSERTVELLGHDRKKWIGIAPFAAYEGKMYPLGLMKTVIKSLEKANRYKIILFGGGKKEESELHALSRQFTNTVPIAGHLDFKDELALISNLDLMLSMDSGNGHLAALYGVPTVTLWGVTHPYAGFYPFGQDPQNALLAGREQFPQIPTSVYGNKYPKGYEEAMATIAPEAVVRKIEQLLSGTAP